MTEGKFKELKFVFDLNEVGTKKKPLRDEIPKLDKKQGLALLKYKLQLQVNLMKEVNFAEFEGDKKQQEAEYFGPAMMNDKFYIQAKMELDQFDLAMGFLKTARNLHKDKEYMMI